MKNILISIPLFFLILQSIYSQEFFERPYIFESLSFSNKHIMQSDSSFYFAGQSRSNNSKLGDLLLLKINYNNDEVFRHEYGSEGFDEGYDLLRDSNFVYIVGEIVVGDTIYQGDIVIPMTDIYLLKTDLNGDTIWTKKYNLNTLDRGTAILKVNNSIVIAAIASDIDNTQIKLLYLNSLGEIIETIPIEGFPDSELKLIETKDSNLILLFKEVYSSDNSKILKIDYNGKIIWEYVSTSSCENIQELNNDGFIIVGSKNHLVFISKINGSGEMVWEKEYEITNYWGNVYDLEVLPNDDFIICGENILDNNFRIIHSFLSKLTFDGELIWYKEFGIGYRSFITTISVLNNGYYASGGLFKDNNWSVYVVKTDLVGNIDTSYITVGINEVLNDDSNDLFIYPNPTNGIINLDYNGKSKLAAVIIYDIYGRMIKEFVGNNIGTRLELDNIEHRLLILKAITVDNYKYIKKLTIY